MTARVPWSVLSGRSGWTAASARAARSSVNFGLYFIVHDPSGKGPLSMP